MLSDEGGKTTSGSRAEDEGDGEGACQRIQAPAPSGEGLVEGLGALEDEGEDGPPGQGLVPPLVRGAAAVLLALRLAGIGNHKEEDEDEDEDRCSGATLVLPPDSDAIR